MEIAGTIQQLQAVPNPAVDMLITGIGVTATTYSITKAIAVNRPDFILQAGIGGCLEEGLMLTTVVAIANETIGDIGVHESSGFQSLFDMKLLQKDTPPWKDGKLANSLPGLKDVGLAVVDGVTVNEICTNTERINYYRLKLNARVESMEGAALHYVALMENIPFLQIRSLSNFAGERDKTRWMMPGAIASLNLEIQRIFSTILSV